MNQIEITTSNLFGFHEIPKSDWHKINNYITLLFTKNSAYNFHRVLRYAFLPPRTYPHGRLGEPFTAFANELGVKGRPQPFFLRGNLEVRWNDVMAHVRHIREGRGTAPREGGFFTSHLNNVISTTTPFRATSRKTAICQRERLCSDKGNTNRILKTLPRPHICPGLANFFTIPELSPK